ncbi:MAG: hypothetical protein U0163_20740 [Gemmatimonadaceae bacterium]
MPLDTRQLRRRLREALPGLEAASDDAPTLESSDLPTEPPHTRDCAVLEGDRFESVPIDGDPVVGFAAFLDGIQTSRVWGYDAGIPIVFGHVAAAIRVRVDRRLTTWSAPREHGGLYAPLEWLSRETAEALRRLGVPLRDTGREASPAPPHPLQLLRVAIHAVQGDREQVEHACADDWCAREVAPLFVDGGVPRGNQAAHAMQCVGVIKSHHTLYAQGDGLRVIASLGDGMRSRVIRIDPTWGPAVASWYLRVRRAPGRDPLWGLVRVEIPLSAGATAGALGERANLVSRWILAERAPWLPDGRWDRMAYGIEIASRTCARGRPRSR